MSYLFGFPVGHRCIRVKVCPIFKKRLDSVLRLVYNIKLIA